mmetsp:Transcript_15715/g.48861  ORF Transcript_15715/g.48861 Transcript_15715/m.48861 type:complete len:214 (+) Transcript_15715:1384-2025(+)
MALLDQLHLGGVGGRGDEVEEGAGELVVVVVHVHPPLHRPAHRLQRAHRHAERLELGKTVDHLELDRRIRAVRERDAADERGEVLVGHGEIEHVRLQPRRLVHLLNLHLVGADEHVAARRVGRGHEGLRREVDAVARALDHRAEGDGRRDLVGLLRRLKHQDPAVLVLDAEGRDALTAVHVEGPHGQAPQAADAGQEGGHRALPVEGAHDEAA